MIKNNSDKLKDIFKELHNLPKKSRNTADLKIDNSLESNNSLVVKGLSAIILQGVKKKASDIHIEPMRDRTRIRYRVDGILYEEMVLDLNLHMSLISRLKIISHLDITEKKLPQDGKFQMEIDKKVIDFRVSIVPLINGEKGVIRILDREILDFNLENIGFLEEDYTKIVQLINKKSGILLSCGPTGSGKSSLIYSILKRLNTESINISTVEDPVEYELDGINQVQYNQEIGRDFATILKSYLRQDPDVLMIGEIRDYETAEIAVKSALTGHLVLSTLHTNDSVSGIYRLLNIGIEKYMLSASIIGIISQRLVRKLCPHCKEIDKNFRGKLSLMRIDSEKYSDKIFYTGRGCEHCNNSGYVGRTAIFEIFIVDEEIRELIDRGISIHELKIVAQEKGMKSLIEDGIEKSILGITSLDEIIRQG
ncbi:GspE/PulE family protein [Fusobacterium sp.]|uniref:GspE/PulE family protein n=1 Tax=Fusobacterium sp. TaxID=68766 RepID=UPI002608489A|nr:GspE/PulE family protein [Fusobacterium sp.]